MKFKRKLFIKQAIAENLFLLVRDSPHYEKCAEEIAKLIWRFAKAYRKLEKYDCGVGDTETDEAVAEIIYDLIHWGEVT